MSLANLFVQGNRAVLQADAAGTDADGKVRFLGSKLHKVEGLPIAVTARGRIDIDALHAEVRGRHFSDADAFFRALPDVMSAVGSAMEAEERQLSSGLYIAAWHGGRARGYVIVTDRSWFNGQIEPYQLMPLLNTVGAIVPAAEMLGRPVDFADPRSFDIERDSLELIEAQRRVPWADFPAGSNPPARVAHRIGGWIDQAEVSAAGLRSRRIAEWPQDRLGRRIAA